MSADVIGRPFGLAPDAGGNGTTPLGLQRIIAAKWLNTGIINGCDITGTATMAYQVGAGAAVVFLDGAMRAVEVPIEATTVATSAAPATGSRDDVIYVDPATYTVKVGAAAPAGAAVLGRARVAAGITGTNAAVFYADNTYAMPYGGSLGQLNPPWWDAAAPSSDAVKELITWWQWTGGTMLTTDRQVELQVDQSIYAATPATLGSMKYRFYITENGTERLERTFELGYTQAWCQAMYRYRFWMLGGRRYSFRISRQSQWDAGPKHFGGEAVDKFERGTVRILDQGIAR